MASMTRKSNSEMNRRDVLPLQFHERAAVTIKRAGDLARKMGLPPRVVLQKDETDAVAIAFREMREGKVTNVEISREFPDKKVTRHSLSHLIELDTYDDDHPPPWELAAQAHCPQTDLRVAPSRALPSFTSRTLPVPLVGYTPFSMPTPSSLLSFHGNNASGSPVYAPTSPSYPAAAGGGASPPYAFGTSTASSSSTSPTYAPTSPSYVPTSPSYGPSLHSTTLPLMPLSPNYSCP